MAKSNPHEYQVQPNNRKRKAPAAPLEPPRQSPADFLKNMVIAGRHLLMEVHRNAIVPFGDESDRLNQADGDNHPISNDTTTAEQLQQQRSGEQPDDNPLSTDTATEQQQHLQYGGEQPDNHPVRSDSSIEQQQQQQQRSGEEPCGFENVPRSAPAGDTDQVSYIQPVDGFLDVELKKDRDSARQRGDYFKDMASELIDELKRQERSNEMLREREIRYENSYRKMEAAFLKSDADLIRLKKREEENLEIGKENEKALTKAWDENEKLQERCANLHDQVSAKMSENVVLRQEKKELAASNQRIIDAANRAQDDQFHAHQRLVEQLKQEHSGNISHLIEMGREEMSATIAKHAQETEAMKVEITELRQQLEYQAQAQQPFGDNASNKDHQIGMLQEELMKVQAAASLNLKGDSPPPSQQIITEQTEPKHNNMVEVQNKPAKTGFFNDANAPSYGNWNNDQFDLDHTMEDAPALYMSGQQALQPYIDTNPAAMAAYPEQTMFANNATATQDDLMTDTQASNPAAGHAVPSPVSTIAGTNNAGRAALPGLIYPPRSQQAPNASNVPNTRMRSTEVAMGNAAPAVASQPAPPQQMGVSTNSGPSTTSQPTADVTMNGVSSVGASNQADRSRLVEINGNDISKEFDKQQKEEPLTPDGRPHASATVNMSGAQSSPILNASNQANKQNQSSGVATPGNTFEIRSSAPPARPGHFGKHSNPGQGVNAAAPTQISTPLALSRNSDPSSKQQQATTGNSQSTPTSGSNTANTSRASASTTPNSIFGIAAPDQNVGAQMDTDMSQTPRKNKARSVAEVDPRGELQRRGREDLERARAMCENQNAQLQQSASAVSRPSTQPIQAGSHQQNSQVIPNAATANQATQAAGNGAALPKQTSNVSTSSHNSGAPSQTPSNATSQSNSQSGSSANAAAGSHQGRKDPAQEAADKAQEDMKQMYARSAAQCARDDAENPEMVAVRGTVQSDVNKSRPSAGFRQPTQSTQSTPNQQNGQVAPTVGPAGTSNSGVPRPGSTAGSQSTFSNGPVQTNQAPSNAMSQSNAQGRLPSNLSPEQHAKRILAPKAQGGSTHANAIASSAANYFSAPSSVQSARPIPNPQNYPMTPAARPANAGIPGLGNTALNPAAYRNSTLMPDYGNLGPSSSTARMSKSEGKKPVTSQNNASESTNAATPYRPSPSQAAHPISEDSIMHQHITVPPRPAPHTAVGLTPAQRNGTRGYQAQTNPPRSNPLTQVQKVDDNVGSAGATKQNDHVNSNSHTHENSQASQNNHANENNDTNMRNDADDSDDQLSDLSDSDFKASDIPNAGIPIWKS